MINKYDCVSLSLQDFEALLKIIGQIPLDATVLDWVPCEVDRTIRIRYTNDACPVREDMEVACYLRRPCKLPLRELGAMLGEYKCHTT